MVRQDIKDKMLVELIKRYLKSGVMENGIVMRTNEGSLQGGNLSPLLANIYLDKFDKEFEGRDIKVIRYVRMESVSKRKHAKRLLDYCR